MKKILASDFDGTFFIKSNEESIIDSVESVKQFREKGNIFVIDTGRSFFHFQDYKTRFNIEYDYIIFDHGALILDHDDNVIQKYEIEKSIVQNLKDDLFAHEYVDGCFSYGFEVSENFIPKNIIKISIKFASAELANEVNEKIKNKYGEYIISYLVNPYSIEIISNATNKSLPIQIVAKREGVFNDDIFSIGDGYSDIDMVRDYHGFAMEDCVEELNDIALKKYQCVPQAIHDLLSAKQ